VLVLADRPGLEEESQKIEWDLKENSVVHWVEVDTVDKNKPDGYKARVILFLIIISDVAPAEHQTPKIDGTHSQSP